MGLAVPGLSAEALDDRLREMGYAPVARDALYAWSPASYASALGDEYVVLDLTDDAEGEHLARVLGGRVTPECWTRIYSAASSPGWSADEVRPMTIVIGFLRPEPLSRTDRARFTRMGVRPVRKRLSAAERDAAFEIFGDFFMVAEAAAADADRVARENVGAWVRLSDLMAALEDASLVHDGLDEVAS